MGYNVKIVKIRGNTIKKTFTLYLEKQESKRKNKAKAGEAAAEDDALPTPPEHNHSSTLDLDANEPEDRSYPEPHSYFHRRLAEVQEARELREHYSHSDVLCAAALVATFGLFYFVRTCLKKPRYE